MTFPKGEELWTRSQVDALLRAVEGMFHRRDIEALVHGFTEDCIVRFSEQPERRGRAALRELFTARLARQKDYRLKKTLLALEGNVLANVWEGRGRIETLARRWPGAGWKCGGCVMA